MDLSDRLLYLIIGCMIGFVAGFIVRGLREVKEEVHELDEHVKRTRNEDGYMRFPVVADIMLLVVVCLTVYAAFASQVASDDVKDNAQDVKANQELIAKSTECNQDFLAKTITALNERTTYSSQASKANVELQKAQRDYISIFDDVPPPTYEESLEAFTTYFKSLDKFVDLTQKSRDKSEDFPYPTAQDFQDCLNEKE